MDRAIVEAGGRERLLRFENIEVAGINAAMRGMRNSYKSHDRASEEKDRELLKNLVKAGPEHRKALRMMIVYVDVTAPLYWWKQFDAYKVGIVENSESTMHTLLRDGVSLDDFNYTDSRMRQELNGIIRQINIEHRAYQIEKDEDKKRAIELRVIGLLPSCFLQKRTLCFNYETARNIYHQRMGHKLPEWKEFLDFLKYLPMGEFIYE